MEELKRKLHQEAQRRYREKNREKINEERRGEKDKRAILRIESLIPSIEELRKIKPVNRLPDRKEGDIQEQTKEKYIEYIKVFYKEYAGEIIDDDHDIIKKIKGIKYKSKELVNKLKKIIEEKYEDIIVKNYRTIHIFYSILRGIRGLTEIEKKLYGVVKHSADTYQQGRSKIKFDIEAINDVKFDEEEIKKNLEKLETIAEKIMYGFTMVFNRRLYDLQNTLKIETREADDTNNYIKGNIWYINKTKNKVKIELELPEYLIELVKEVRDGEYIFGKLYHKSTVSQMFNSIMLKIYGKIYTANNMRHIYITQINQGGKSYKELNDLAKQSGHTITEQQKYIYREG
jgi:hypothetical protein